MTQPARRMKATGSAQNDLALRLALETFLAKQSGGDIRAEKFKRYTVGFSWATFGVEISGAGAAALPAQSLILRLGPDSGLYAPYSSKPQYMVLKALEGSPVPVPRVFWHDDDRQAFGLPFFISERVAGDAPVPSDSSPNDLVTRFRDQIGRQFINALAAMHGFAWENSVLADWGAGITRANAAIIQVDWSRAEYQRITSRPVPAIDWALHWLRRNAPGAPSLSLVHGDFRIGNFLAVNEKITAILDWESAHIGDPHEDVAYAALPQFTGGTGMVCRMLPKAAFHAAYEKAAGHQLNGKSLHFYTVLGQLKFALVTLAALRRSEQPGAPDIRMAALGTQLPSTLRMLQKTIEAGHE